MRRNIGIMIGLFFLSGCACTSQIKSSFHPAVDATTQQVIVVEALLKNKFPAKVYVLERKSQGWRMAFRPMKAVVGRNGVAPEGEKREGDGRTPSGIFSLNRSFGYATQIETGLDYAQVTKDDLWIDDPESAQYNQWVKAPTKAKSYEFLHRKDKLYKLAAVIEYNTAPIVRGNGSAIFLHIWRGRNQSTSGCVALKERDVRRILKWLDKTRNPQMIIQEAKN